MMTTTVLADWAVAMEGQLAADDLTAVTALAQVLLRKVPRHLATYQRLLEVAWRLRRWSEGEDWGRRLLRADPTNALAWRALAMAAEQRGERAQAQAIWQRAFEAAPYEPEIRAGLSRTTLHPTDAPRTPVGELPTLVLNLACLATFYRRGLRWERAATTYRQLLHADARRIDFQIGLMAALWQQRSRQAAYQLAQHLTGHHPQLLIAWMALQALGDANDKALARAPIAAMDPDGEFTSSWFGLHYEAPPTTLSVSATEAALLRSYVS
jgi:tetratricopeptide (TPR) repeat protein